MKTIRKILNLVPLFTAYFILVFIFWAWIFTFLTDAPRENKILLYIDAAVPGEKEISLMLEDENDPEIRFVKVKPFTYSMMDSSGIRAADLYIVRESNIMEYKDWFAPLPEALHFTGEAYEIDGAAHGIPVYDFLSASGICVGAIEYEAENYYLFIGKESVHMDDTDSGGRTVTYAKRLLGWE